MAGLMMPAEIKIKNAVQLLNESIQPSDPLYGNHYRYVSCEKGKLYLFVVFSHSDRSGVDDNFGSISTPNSQTLVNIHHTTAANRGPLLIKICRFTENATATLNAGTSDGYPEIFYYAARLE